MKVLKLTTLSLAIIVSSQADAIYNLYKKDGLTMDISGEINLNASNKREQFEFQYQKPDNISLMYANTSWKQLLSGAYEERTDRRTRLGQEYGASWLEFRGAQKMADDWRVTGTVGFGYWSSNSNAYLNNASLAFDKKNVGAIGLGRQYLHTNYVARTDTYTPLNTFGATSVRVDYTAIPDLHLSVYYGFPASSDVRATNTTKLETKGFGVSGSYHYDIDNNQSIRGALGYTDSRYNPTLTQTIKGKPNPTRTANNIPVDDKSYAGSLEYRYDRYLLGVDYGHKKEDMVGNIIDSAITNNYGIKIGAEITPKLSLSAGYGERTTKRKNQDGAIVVGGYGDGVSSSDYTNIALAYESFLFDKVKEKRAYVRGDYLLRENVRLYGRFDKASQQTYLTGQNFAKLDNTEYRVGVSFLF